MPSVSIHPPKTPVTEGSNGIAAATIPNVCKMPGPPAPFVPTPLPNIAKSGMSPDGFSTTVKIEGNKVAIRGATFKSMGDEASKGTGGGLLSMNTAGPAKFITPGSFTVQIEGKAVHLLGEPMLNNLGPSGSPPNTGATMAGVMQGVSMTDLEAAIGKQEAADLCAEICGRKNRGRGQSRDVEKAFEKKHPGFSSQKGNSLNLSTKTPTGRASQCRPDLGNSSTGKLVELKLMPNEPLTTNQEQFLKELKAGKHAPRTSKDFVLVTPKDTCNCT
jgi:hypothetical protein